MTRHRRPTPNPGTEPAITADTTTTADTNSILRTVAQLADQRHGPANGRQRFVPLLAARAATGLPPHRFDRAVLALATDRRVWLATDDQSTPADDAAAVRLLGHDHHLISADPWCSTAV